MAKRKGKGGKVRLDGVVVAHIRDWSLSQSTETADSTTMDDDDMTHEATQNSWEAQANLYWDKADAGQDEITNGSSVVVDIMPEGADTGSEYYTGTATIINIERKGEFSGMVEASATLQGNGALTVSTVI